MIKLKKTLLFAIYLLFIQSCAKKKIHTTPHIKKKERRQKEKAQKAANCVCIEIYQPVCGSDGKTYANSCFADCKGLKYSEGECSSNF